MEIYVEIEQTCQFSIMINEFEQVTVASTDALYLML